MDEQKYSRRQLSQEHIRQLRREYSLQLIDAKTPSDRLLLIFQNETSLQFKIILMVSVCVSLWRLAYLIFTSPTVLQGFLIVPLSFGFLFILFFTIGWIGWLIFRAVPSFIRVFLHVIHAPEREEDTLSDEPKVNWSIIFLTATAVFIGIPEIVHAAEWWQETFLRFIPHEEEILGTSIRMVVNWCYKYKEFIIIGSLACSVVAALAIYTFRKRFKFTRRYVMSIGQILNTCWQRLAGWRGVAFVWLLILISVTSLIWGYWKNAYAPVALSVEMLLLVGLYFWPIWSGWWFVILTFMAILGIPVWISRNIVVNFSIPNHNENIIVVWGISSFAWVMFVLIADFLDGLIKSSWWPVIYSFVPLMMLMYAAVPYP